MYEYVHFRKKYMFIAYKEEREKNNCFDNFVQKKLLPIEKKNKTMH